jgi:AAHS family benzoate transporter-like MFS transporter
MQLPLEQNVLVIGAAGVVGAIALACINHSRSASELMLKTSAAM